MSLRTFAVLATAAALLGSGVAPSAGTAHAAACAAWTDAEGDATTNQIEQIVLKDANLDVVAASLATAGTKVVATIRVKDLFEEAYSDAGDQFAMQLKPAGTTVLLIAERSETSVVARVAGLSSSAPQGQATATFDQFENTVTITTTVAEIDKVAGTRTGNVEATGLAVDTGAQVGGSVVFAYDTAPAPAGTVYTVGAQCAPAVEPAPPLRMPHARCNDVDDGTADDGIPTIAGAVPTQNDAGLDVRWVAFDTTDKRIFAYLKIAQLGRKPAAWQGDRFELTFAHGGKTYTYAVGRLYEGKRAGPHPTRGYVGTTANKKLKVYGTFDTVNSMVVIEVDRAALHEVHGSAIPDGTTVTAVAARSFALLPGYGGVPADDVQAADAAERTYEIGSGRCFEPVPATLVNAGVTTVRFSDAAALAAKLAVAEDGQALAGRPVTFTVGSRTLTATTDASGVAKATLPAGLTAGSYGLVVSFAGDEGVRAVSLRTPFTVAQEKTKLALTVARNGTRRTVTAKLTDDDKVPVAGQVVTWYVDGRKVSAPRTSSAGVVTLTSAKPAQTVKAVFAAVSGKYLAAAAQTKV